jgi:hypothetical protein
VKNGVPFDVAFSLNEGTRDAWGMIFREMEEGPFDWDEGKWPSQKPRD